MSLIDNLRIDDEFFDWKELGSCRGLDEELWDSFFDDYEVDSVVAENTDAMCFSCPVAKQCLQNGVRGQEWGVWGGVYLVNGKVDKARNRHKTDEDWQALKRINGKNVKV